MGQSHDTLVDKIVRIIMFFLKKEVRHLAFHFYQFYIILWIILIKPSLVFLLDSDGIKEENRISKIVNILCLKQQKHKKDIFNFFNIIQNEYGLEVDPSKTTQSKTR